MSQVPRDPCTSAPLPEGLMNLGAEEIDVRLDVIEGELPSDLYGHAFLITAAGSVAAKPQSPNAVFTSGGGNSLFNGDGLIYRFDFDRPGEVHLKTRLAKTPCYYADLASTPGNPDANLGFDNLGLARLSFPLGFRNEINTAFVPIKRSDEEHWRLAVTWDAGRPYEIDPATLEVATPIGRTDEWKAADLPLGMNNVPFQLALTGAHSFFDPKTDEFFAVNWSFSFFSLFAKIIAYDWTKHISIKWLKYAIARLVMAATRFIEWLLKPILHGKFEGFLYLLRWDGCEQDLKSWKVVLPNGRAVEIQQSLHQLGVTEDYVILMDTAFKIGLEQLLNYPFRRNLDLDSQLRNIIDTPQLKDTPIYIIRRQDLTGDRDTVTARKVKLKREAAHFLVDYENPEGKIILHTAHNCAWDPSEWVRDCDRTERAADNPHTFVGMPVGSTDVNWVGRYAIDGETGRIDEERSHCFYDRQYTWATALYAYNGVLPPNKLESVYWISWGCWPELLTEFMLDMYAGYDYREIPVEEVKQITGEGLQTNLCRLDTTSKEAFAIVDSYQFPPGYFANSPQFIPRKDSEGEADGGYLACVVVYNDEDSVKHGEVWLFDAADLNAGPRCKLAHPQVNLGISIHSTWLPEIAPRTALYSIPVRQDYRDLVAKCSPQVREFFEKAVYPHFERSRP
ncbi:carotenoid oxygenase family protein [Oxynema aestuarii]|uniref:Lignostilbene-alpha,beta-dioxygenase n=1 Tax=Oxynema aestuarii AP17 TaxID=2064643 RepID=A0A6H1U3M7_9CYAN|nr:carotenoid oxygenase family protein [Oxynema aestuarii]QIZ73444.1 lignostilbene-alpha,beta-dioxygenase [Oxynema aestuarii AP17]